MSIELWGGETVTTGHLYRKLARMKNIEQCEADLLGVKLLAFRCRSGAVKKKTKRQTQNDQPKEINWQPLSNLPLIVQLIDEGVADAETQEALLEEGKERPHVFDSEMIRRIKKLHTEKLEFVDIYLEQIERWKKETLTMDEHFELARLSKQCGRLKVLIASILELSEQIGKQTIDKILSMDDAELGLRFLMGEIK